jgi:phosphatidate cytidylyltransferase
MLRHRVPSAILMVAGLIALMWLDQLVADALRLPGLVMVVGLLLPFVLLASSELSYVMKAKDRPTPWEALALGGAAGLFTGWVGELLGKGRGGTEALLPVGLGLVLLGWVLLLTLRKHRNPAGAIPLAAGMALGFTYLGLLPGAWVWVRVGYSPAALAGAVMVIKSSDIGAYFTGRALGRHKLIPWLSPGKTWEGLVGGTLLAASVSVGLAAWGTHAGLLPAMPMWFAAVSGGLLALVGQAGDLFASALKRDAGVKDFASSIPGFGGVLDVADSLLLAGPVLLAILKLAQLL